MKILLLQTRPINTTANYEAVLQHLNIDYTLSEELDDEYDGLIVPGGIDVDPALYNQPVNEKCGYFDTEFDKKQIAIINKFIDQKKPIFGICRGHQIINVALGGTLIQHIESNITHTRTPEKETFHQCNNQDSFMLELFGPKCVVNSSHHQSIDLPGKGLRVISYADDGIVEAAVHDTLPIITVQFHPERITLAYKNDVSIDGLEIFNYFFKKYF